MCYAHPSDPRDVAHASGVGLCNGPHSRRGVHRYANRTGRIIPVVGVPPLHVVVIGKCQSIGSIQSPGNENWCTAVCAEIPIDRPKLPRIDRDSRRPALGVPAGAEGMMAVAPTNRRRQQHEREQGRGHAVLLSTPSSHIHRRTLWFGSSNRCVPWR